jgi:preprotein translocase SecE subunit
VADVAVRGESPGVVTRVRRYVADVSAEMRRVTWPDSGQIRQLSIGVVVLSLFIGAVIALIDIVLRNVLLQWIPGLFGG